MQAILNGGFAKQRLTANSSAASPRQGCCRLRAAGDQEGRDVCPISGHLVPSRACPCAPGHSRVPPEQFSDKGEILLNLRWSELPEFFMLFLQGTHKSTCKTCLHGTAPPNAFQCVLLKIK